MWCCGTEAEGVRHPQAKLGRQRDVEDPHVIEHTRPEEKKRASGQMEPICGIHDIPNPSGTHDRPRPTHKRIININLHLICS